MSEELIYVEGSREDYQRYLAELESEWKTLFPASHLHADLSIEEAMKLILRRQAVEALLPLVRKKADRLTNAEFSHVLVPNPSTDHLTPRLRDQYVTRVRYLQGQLDGTIGMQLTPAQIGQMSSPSAGAALGLEFEAVNRKAIQKELDDLNARLAGPAPKQEQVEGDAA